MGMSVEVTLELLGETDDLYLYSTHDRLSPIDTLSVRKAHWLDEEPAPTLVVRLLLEAKGIVPPG